MIQELRFWLRMLRKSNGYRIRQEEEVITFDCVGGSDAGGHQAGGALVEELQPGVDSIFKFHLSSEDQKKSSTFRELLGLKEGLELLPERLRGKRVLWRNDNWAVSLIVQFGSMKAELHDLACGIVELCNMYQIHLKVEWMSRKEKFQICDQLSKDFEGL